MHAVEKQCSPNAPIQEADCVGEWKGRVPAGKAKVLCSVLPSLLFMLTTLLAAAQSTNVPSQWAMDCAYEDLVHAQFFSFGPVGIVGYNPPGEAFNLVSQSTNALALFSKVFTNGNDHGRLFALCGIQRLAPDQFPSYLEAVRKQNSQTVWTMRGCVVTPIPLSNILSCIESNYYGPFPKRR